MGTSRSSDGGTWVASAAVFSGRPDPEWPAPAALVERARALWEGMRPLKGPDARPTPPGLGYRGCSLRGPGGRWDAFSGVVVLREGDRSEARLDEGRAFERMLLESAPADVLPPGLIAGLAGE